MEQKDPLNLGKMSGTFSIVSLILGIFAIMSCISPPIQLLFGAAALMLAYLSKNGKRLTGPAVAGTVLGILGIIFSILIFIYFMATVRLMDDPANMALFRQAMSQYQELINGLNQK